MSRYRAYQAYRIASSRWLDVLPEHWMESRLKHVVATPVTDGPHETPRFQDDGVAFLSAEAVKENRLNFAKKRGWISRSLHEVYSKKCLPRRGDIFMVKSGATTGALAMVETDEEFNIWSPLALFRPEPARNASRFMFYSMRAEFFQRSVQLSWSYGTQQNIGMGVLENLHVACPPLSEQTQIAKFLDYETAKIDGLIEKQEQLIALLKEKRQAVISHAVTKGLNPDAPMRDSGVDWLGEVPAHWEVCKVGHQTDIYRGKFTHRPRNEPRFYGGKYPFIQTGDVARGSKYITEYSQTLNEKGFLISREFPKGTLCMVITGAKTGSVAILDFKACFPDSVVGFYPKSKEKGVEYLFYALQALKQYFDSVAVVSTQENLNVERISAATWAWPPADEQIEVAEHLADMLERMTLVEKQGASLVALLQERRTALISAAVTGKIDVRNWKPSSAAPTNESEVA